MRRTLTRLAALKPARYLEPGTPTGLTGLLTAAHPRSQLIYLYSSTLEKLSSLPETSLYRQSTEALTKHRMSIVESVVPEGYEQWTQKAKETIKAHPEVFNTPTGGVDHISAGGEGMEGKEGMRRVVVGGKTFVESKEERVLDEVDDEWDGEKDLGPELEGTRTQEEKANLVMLARERPGSDGKTVTLEKEPGLSVEQIEEIENKIGAGLIEEVIQVAEGELKLVDTMLKAKVWEDLEEKPVEGQWTYFMRDTATPTTQPPPQK
ncbi:NADH-ubiquinone oxidoreductase-like protein 299 kDa subunit [Acephala macrosclerotiorum]|nr:NADH-ubiquinone oxidoreductase-like protein 299 kDa subunit [Acephala macrosclerotiorum]